MNEPPAKSAAKRAVHRRPPKSLPVRQTRTLATLVELAGLSLRSAVREIAFVGDKQLAWAWQRTFQPRLFLQDAKCTAERAARLLAVMWMTAARFSGSGPSLTWREAEAWFRGDAVPADEPWLSDAVVPDSDRALLKLRSTPLDEQAADLLPYLLEPYQRGSRLSVRRDRSHVVDRLQKKAGGVFYTPADVAEHMCKVALGGTKAKRPVCLDPACGTGVFLRCLLRQIANAGATSRLDVAGGQIFGFDVSPVALDAAAFVLLWDCLSSSTAVAKSPAPWAAWHRIRMNLLEIDTLTVGPPGRGDRVRRAGADARQQAADALRANCFVAAGPLPVDPADAALSLFEQARKHRLDHLFPEAAAGFDVYVGNPPYSPIGAREDADLLAANFTCVGSKPLTSTENIYPLFIEQMWRLTSGRGSGVVVVPLSIAFHRGARFQLLRRGMGGRDVTWRCEFYDREPHALFGEDAKTRNAIVAMVPGPRQLYTGPLVRWTSRTRASLFDNLRYVRWGGDYEDGIPKLADDVERETYERLQVQSGFGRLVVRIGRAGLDDVARRGCNRNVYLASTAYNFLNVFPQLESLPGHRLSENPLQQIVCADDESAWAVYACLSSHVAFWTWYVRCDGFHVARWFVDEFPAAGRLSTAAVKALSLIGQTLWSSVRARPVVSNNKGRHTVAFPQLAHGLLRTQADLVLLEAAGVPASFAEHLKQFVRDLVVLDPADASRAKRACSFETEAAADV